MQVAYIGPHGFSGSTVVDVALAQHRDVVSGGELRYLPRWLKLDLLCTCQRPLSRCDFWSEVLDSEHRAGLHAIARHGLGNDSVVTGLWQSLLTRMSDVAHASVVVDSSKDINRYRMLREAFPRRNLFVHMVRPLKEVVTSAAATKASPAISPGAVTTPSPPLRSAARWARDHGQARALRRLESWNYIRVTHPELVADPEGELQRLTQHLGLNFVSEMLTLDCSHLHNISGSRWRFSPAAVQGELTISAQDVSPVLATC